jgi:heat shock protein HslJ
MRYCSLLILLTVLSAACSSSSNLPTAPSAAGDATALTADQLAGTWQLHSMQAAGGTQQARPAGAAYTLTFNADRVSTRVDCNQCSGGYSIVESTLTIAELMACTRAACPTMAFEQAYTTLLAGQHVITIVDNVMMLTSPRGELRFTR